MFMCTNKTCFAGVGTWPKPLFRIRISCLSYPCESKKNQNLLSADQTSIPGVNQVFLVLEWNLIFVLLSKILDRLKRLFVVQIPRVEIIIDSDLPLGLPINNIISLFLESLFIERCGTYTFNSFSLALWRSRNEGDLFGSWKIDADKSCNQLLKIVLRYRGHLHEESYKGIFRYSKEWKSFTIDIVSKSAQNTHLTAEPILKQCAVYGSRPPIASKPCSSSPEH